VGAGEVGKQAKTLVSSSRSACRPTQRPRPSDAQPEGRTNSAAHVGGSVSRCIVLHHRDATSLLPICIHAYTLAVVRLSPGAVVDGGVRLAMTSGVDAVGVRALAAELAVTPMALYRHVDDAQALRDAVVARLLEDLPVVPVEGEWRARVVWWAQEARRVFASAPGLARFVLRHWTELPSVLAAVDSMGSMFEGAGPEGTDAVAAANTVFSYVLMRAQAEETLGSEGRSRTLVALREHRDKLPFLWEHRDEYSVARMDEHFRYGLDVILAGLASTPAPLRSNDADS
jgi:AcrR family transcriptional regulator